VSYTADALNRYTAVGAVTPSYDGNSNLTSDGTFTFGYDAENRLTSANGAGNTASYTYDAQGRRKTKTVNGTTTVFVTDAGNREVLEYDGSSGAILRWYAYGLGSNDVLSQMNVGSATRATLVPDILGSIIATQASTTGALSQVGYLPYGKSVSSGPFGFTGQRIDAETNGLYYYRARQYSSAWGRFLQSDPTGYGGGSHLYAYVSNDPLNFIDPTGLSADGPFGSRSSSGSLIESAASTSLDANVNFLSSSDFVANARDASSGDRTVQLAAMVKDPQGDLSRPLLDPYPKSSGSGGGGGSTSGTSPNFIAPPGGTAFPVPNNAIGPSDIATRSGFLFQGGSGGYGFSPNTSGLRIMDPVTSGPYTYPNGYGVYMNRNDQTINPFTGRTISPTDPLAHIPR
jgi:RHS repeat-associated protein